MAWFFHPFDDSWLSACLCTCDSGLPNSHQRSLPGTGVCQDEVLGRTWWDGQQVAFCVWLLHTPPIFSCLHALPAETTPRWGRQQLEKLEKVKFPDYSPFWLLQNISTCMTLLCTRGTLVLLFCPSNPSNFCSTDDSIASFPRIFMAVVLSLDGREGGRNVHSGAIWIQTSMYPLSALVFSSVEQA